MSERSKKIQDELVNLGLSEKEALLYKEALSLGTFTINSISFQTKLKRPTCYFIVDNLMEKGLISKAADLRKSKYIAERPQSIVTHLKKSLYRAEVLAKELEKESYQGNKPAVRVFTGQGGVEQVYEDMVSKKDTVIKSFIDTDSLLERTGDYFLKEWIDNRKKNNVSIKSLINDHTFKYGTDQMELRDNLILPSDIKLQGSIGVYGNKVLYLSNQKDDFCLLIENEAFKKTIESIFDHIWNQNKNT